MTSPGAKRLLCGCLAATATVLACTAPRVHAQAPAGAAAGAIHYEFYRFTSPVPGVAKSVSLASAPFALRLTLPWGLIADASGAVARGDVDLEGGTRASLSGLTDTELRLTARLRAAGTLLALSAVGLLPTGHESLTLEEALVAGMIASDILPFRISNWGSGGGRAVELAAIRPVAGGSIGIGASFRLAGAFQPFQAAPVEYHPGHELRLRVAVDQAFANARTLALQLAYSRFGDDEWAGYPLFRSGQRLLAVGSYAAPLGGGVASAYAGVLHRSGGALAESIWFDGLLSGMLAPPSETLVVLGSSARLPWQRRLLAPAIDFRLLKHGNGTGSEMLVGFGGSAELPVGERGALLVPTIRLRLGKLLLMDDTESGVRGVELGLGVRLGAVE